MSRIIARKVFGWGGTLVTLFIVLVLWLGEIYGGKIEGRFFPVVANTSIVEMQPVGPYSTRILGQSEKLRACPFDRIEWYIGTPSAYSVVPVLFEDRSTARPAGPLDFGPWLLRMTAEEIKNRSFAVVFHRCHPFWLTETRFYP